MNERGIGVLEQYDFEVKNIYKGRGFLILDTTSGPKSFRAFSGARKKLVFQDCIQQRLYEAGMKNDRIVANKEGELISKDKDETFYIVREWFDARELNLREEREIYAAAEHLAAMHRLCRNMIFPEETPLENYRQDVRAILQKHNREMKKTRNFMRERSGKTDFEICFLKCFQEYYEKGLYAERALRESSYEHMSEQAAGICAVCHGSYNHHNVVWDGGHRILLDFERCHIDLQMDDLYDFMRKVLEKWDWDIRVGKYILEHYDKVLSVSDEELEYLRIRLCYPEKFWKIANHYYNSRKSWIPDKNMEKLCKVLGQEEKKEEFLRQIR